jgi:hypothetical protein
MKRSNGLLVFLIVGIELLCLRNCGFGEEFQTAIHLEDYLESYTCEERARSMLTN